MDKLISLCGDDCSQCPRYLARTDGELSRAAELWRRVGWRKSLEPPENMRCGGCSAGRSCHYGLAGCAKERGLSRCRECGALPCEKIIDMLARSDQYELICRERCSPEEFCLLERAFFHKRENIGLVTAD